MKMIPGLSLFVALMLSFSSSTALAQFAEPFDSAAADVKVNADADTAVSAPSPNPLPEGRGLQKVPSLPKGGVGGGLYGLIPATRRDH